LSEANHHFSVGGKACLLAVDASRSVAVSHGISLSVNVGVVRAPEVQHVTHVCVEDDAAPEVGIPLTYKFFVDSFDNVLARCKVHVLRGAARASVSCGCLSNSSAGLGDEDDLVNVLVPENCQLGGNFYAVVNIHGISRITKTACIADFTDFSSCDAIGSSVAGANRACF